jgi:hypothetical protein
MALRECPYAVRYRSPQSKLPEDAAQAAHFVIDRPARQSFRQTLALVPHDVVCVEVAHKALTELVLPNAFLFGLTGTPINRADRNTFWAFGADEDEKGYMSRYSFQESIRDKATLPLHFGAGGEAEDR